MVKYARKKTKRTTRRRVIRRKRISRASVSRSSVAPFPDRFITKLNYSELTALNYLGFGVPAVHLFRCNSIFDPNYSGVGHQPLGHDEYAQLYNRYRVYGMKWKIYFSNRSSSDHAEIAVLYRPNDTLINVMETVYESPHCVYKATMGVETGGQAVKVASGYVSIAKIRGVSKATMNAESDYQAQIGSTPTFAPTLQIYCYNTNTATSIVIAARVELTYYTQFSDRKIMNQS